jgi:hypothetical protein
MRTLVTCAILGPVLIALASPAEAGRGGMHGGMHGGATVRIVVGSHHNRVVVVPNHNKVVVVPNHRFFNQQFAFNRFARAGQFGQFGFSNGFGGFGGWGYGGGDYGYASPTVAYAPPAVVQLTPPAPPPTRVAANLPPCHEVTSSGVTIDRGMGCSRAEQ